MEGVSTPGYMLLASGEVKAPRIECHFSEKLKSAEAVSNLEFASAAIPRMDFQH